MEHWLGELVTLILMSFALGMDAFSVGLGMGMFKLRLRQIATIGITVGLFHIWMPLVGIIAGRILSDQFGKVTAYAGAGLLLFLGLQMLLTGLRGKEEVVVAPFGTGLLLFALSVSLDSFSVGLSLGIMGAKTVITIICFGAVAVVLTWAGLLLGRKVQRWLGVYSQVLGGSILFAFGLKVIFHL